MSHQPHHQLRANQSGEDNHDDWSSSSDCLVAMIEQPRKKTPDFLSSSSFHSSFTSFHASAIFDEAFAELQSEITHLFDDEVPDQKKTEQDNLDLADLTSHTIVMSDSYTTDEDDDDARKSRSSSDVEYYSDSDEDDDFSVPDKVLEEIQREMLMVDMANQQPPPPPPAAAATATAVGAQGMQEDRVASETKSKRKVVTAPPPLKTTTPNTSTSSPPPPSVAKRAPIGDSTSTIPTTAMRQSRSRDLLHASSHSRSAHGNNAGPSTTTRPTNTPVDNNAYRRNRRTTPYSSSSLCSRDAVEPLHYSDRYGSRGSSASVTSASHGYSRRNAALNNNSYHRQQEGSPSASASSKRYQPRTGPNVRRSTTSAAGYRPSPPAYTTTTTQPSQAVPPRQGHYQRPQRPVETTPTMIEIAPGVSARLRGASETWQAIERDEFLVGVTCWGCDQHDLCCVSGATHVLCPTCRVMSPLPGLEDAAGYNNRKEPVVGLGFTYEDLRKWQSEILRGRRTQANQRYNS